MFQIHHALQGGYIGLSLYTEVPHGHLVWFASYGINVKTRVFAGDLDDLVVHSEYVLAW